MVTLMEICSSHYKEDLEWLRKSKFPVTVVTHEGGDPVPDFIHKVYKIPNEGFEASSYLAFIIKRMTSNTLPEYTAFIHGHETSTHQHVDNLLDAIENHPGVQYYTLNNAWAYKFTDDEDKYVDVEKFEQLIGPIPKTVWTDLSAQFVVHRDCIMRHDISFYKNLFKNVKTKRDATSMEFLWHIIFGQPAHMRPPPGANIIPTWIVPDPHKMVLGVKCEGDPPRFGYPIENIRKVDERDPYDPNMLFVEIKGDKILVLGSEFSTSDLFPLYFQVLKNSVTLCPFKGDFESYCKPLFERLSEYTYVHGDDVLRDLFSIDSSRDNLVCVDVRTEKNQWALQCFIKWYEERVRVVLYDVLTIILIAKHETPETRLNLENVVVDGKHLEEV